MFVKFCVCKQVVISFKNWKNKDAWLEYQRLFLPSSRASPLKLCQNKKRTWNTNLIELQNILVNFATFKLNKMYGRRQNSQQLSMFPKFYVQSFWNVRRYWLVNLRAPQYPHFWRVAIQENLESPSTPQLKLKIPHLPKCLRVLRLMLSTEK